MVTGLRRIARLLHEEIASRRWGQDEFEKLMAEGQAARKSGRPRKHPLPPLKTGSALRPPQMTPPSFAAVPSLADTLVMTPVAVPAAVPVVAQAAKSAKPTSKSKARPKAKAKARPKAKAKAKGKRKR